MEDIVESCVTSEALERLQQRQRPLLKAIGREQPELYAQIGASFAKRTAELNGEGCAISQEDEDGEQCAMSPTGEDGEQCAMSPTSKDGEQCATFECQAVQIEPPAPRRMRRNREDEAEQTNGEACAKRTHQRSSQPTPRRTRKRASDASVTAPEPA